MDQTLLPVQQAQWMSTCDMSMENWFFTDSLTFVFTKEFKVGSDQ